MSCCLRNAPQMACCVRALPWSYQAAVQTSAKEDPFFTSCTHFVSSRLFDWTPREVAAFIEAFSRSSQPDAVRTLLWQAEERLLPFLEAKDLIALLQACMVAQVREHGVEATDVFVAAQPHLLRHAGGLSAAQIRRVCQVYHKVCFVPTEETFTLFEALGRRLEEVRKAKETDQVVLAFLSACSRINLALADVVSWPRPTKQTVVPLLQMAAKLGKEVWNEEYRALVKAHLAAEPSVVSLGQLIFPIIAGLPRGEDMCELLLEAVGRKRVRSTELSSQLGVLGLALKLEAPHIYSKVAAKLAVEEKRAVELPNKSSQQHYEVASALRELGLDHDMEVHMDPYVVDVRLHCADGEAEPEAEGGSGSGSGGSTIVEIDGPMHFQLFRAGGDGVQYRYDFKTKLKHRLLSKSGHRVFHVPYHHWPAQRTDRFLYVKELLYGAEPLSEL